MKLRNSWRRMCLVWSIFPAMTWTSAIVLKCTVRVIWNWLFRVQSNASLDWRIAKMRGLRRCPGNVEYTPEVFHQPKHWVLRKGPGGWRRNQYRNQETNKRKLTCNQIARERLLQESGTNSLEYRAIPLHGENNRLSKELENIVDIHAFTNRLTQVVNHKSGNFKSSRACLWTWMD